MRLSAPLKPWAIQRMSDLTFSLTNSALITDLDNEVIIPEPVEEKLPGWDF
jgi:hypothetical protein